MYVRHPARCRYTAHYGETLTSPWDYVRYEARARVRQLKRRWLKLTADPTCAPLAAKLQELAMALHLRLLALIGEPGPARPKCRGVKKGAFVDSWLPSTLSTSRMRCFEKAGLCVSSCLLLNRSGTSPSRPSRQPSVPCRVQEASCKGFAATTQHEAATDGVWQSRVSTRRRLGSTASAAAAHRGLGVAR